MKGAFAMIVFLLLAASLVAMVAAARNEQAAFEEAVKNSMRKKELFYAARDAESLFWQSANASLRDWTRDCVRNSADCTDVHLSELAVARILDWRNYIENQPVDFSVKVFEGDYSTPDSASEPSFDVVETLVTPNRTDIVNYIRLYLPAGASVGVSVYSPIIRIKNSGTSNALLVRVSDGKYTQYGIIGVQESAECFLAQLSGNVGPIALEINGINNCEAS